MGAFIKGLKKYMYTQECDTQLVESGSSSIHCKSTPFMALLGDKDERISHRLKSISETEWNSILREQLASGVLVHLPTMPKFNTKAEFKTWFIAISISEYNTYAMADISHGNEFTEEQLWEGACTSTSAYHPDLGWVEINKAMN